MSDETSHPDCRYCEERLRINLGLMAENRKLREQIGNVAPEDLSPKKFADHLRGHRAQARMTRRELANSVGIAERTLQRIESGDHRTRPEVARLLADAVGWS